MFGSRNDIGATAMRVAETGLIAGAAAAAFAWRAQIEALRAAAWCGDTPATLKLLDHCVACWGDGAAAGVAAALTMLIAKRLTIRTVAAPRPAKSSRRKLP